jgi:hypothetical protein
VKLKDNIVNIYEHLSKGKDLKKGLKDLKPIKNIVVPMGSNFDNMEPDLGVIIEEKGRAKKGP